jgi:rfaE bifunctional protein kinase chain/domain
MKNLEDVRILVVGDIMLDRYVEGNIERISPEAPVPIVNVINEYHTLGGCGNVVINLRELGVEVDCLASIGTDAHGVVLANKLDEAGARSLLFYGSKKTTVKERIIADHRKMQILRIDREDTELIEHNLAIDIYTRMCHDEYDLIVVSDYAKGMMTHELMDFLRDKQNARIIVDPKPKNGSMYNKVFMITPNEKEWDQMINDVSYHLKDVPYILQTLGNKGMCLMERANNKIYDVPSEKVEVYNVTGAGDTVISVVSACIAVGVDITTAVKIANKCAGYVVTKPGTTPITREVFDQIYYEIHEEL